MIDAATRKKRRLFRERCAARMRAQWADPEYRKRQSALRSAFMKRLWSNPITSKRRRDKLVALNRSEKHRKKSGQRMLAFLADPAFVAKLARNMKLLHERPEIQRRTKVHAAANARRVHAARRRNRDVVPPGKMKLYKKLRAHGVDRKEALRQCWIAP